MGSFMKHLEKDDLLSREPCSRLGIYSPRRVVFEGSIVVPCCRPSWSLFWGSGGLFVPNGSHLRVPALVGKKLEQEIALDAQPLQLCWGPAVRDLIWHQTIWGSSDGGKVGWFSAKSFPKFASCLGQVILCTRWSRAFCSRAFTSVLLPLTELVWTWMKIWRRSPPHTR